MTTTQPLMLMLMLMLQPPMQSGPIAGARE
jgi:hypothetical protein